MESIELKNNLRKKFNILLERDESLFQLDGILDGLSTEDTNLSKIPDSHYLKVEERRSKYHNGETKSKDWDTTLKELLNKYGA